MTKLKNIFMGNYHEILRVMLTTIGVSLVIVEKNKVEGKIRAICKDNQIKLLEVSSSQEINKEIAQDSWDNCLIGSFGLILRNESIDSIKSIYNFHPGNVYDCRGRHPLPTSILRGDKYIAVSAHKIIDEQIDRGPLVSQIFIALDYSKSYSFNYERLLKFLKSLAGDLCEMISERNNIPTWSWHPHPSSYHKPIHPVILAEIINSKDLREYEK